MNVLSTKFKTLATLSSMVLLTACNSPTQPAKTEKPTTVTSSTVNSTTNPAATDPHAGHAMATQSSTTAVDQPAHIAAYRQSMTAMHDQMMSATHITNPDVAFATGMIPHHQGAVDMAKIELKYGKDRQMRNLAENIINAQQAEIQQMQTWLDTHKADKAPVSTLDNATVPKMDMKNHDAMMQGIMATDPDVAFAKGMIPHHQGAIEMANTQLKLGKDNTMLDLASRIKSAQDPEIKQMQAWLDSRGDK